MVIDEARGFSEVMKNTKLRIYVGIATLVAALMAAPAAFAGSAVETYSGAGGASAAGVASGASASTASDPGSLPFTGLDVGLLIGGGLVLLLIGVAMARLARRTSPQNS